MKWRWMALMAMVAFVAALLVARINLRTAAQQPPANSSPNEAIVLEMDLRKPSQQWLEANDLRSALISSQADLRTELALLAMLNDQDVVKLRERSDEVEALLRDESIRQPIRIAVAVAHTTALMRGFSEKDGPALLRTQSLLFNNARAFDYVRALNILWSAKKVANALGQSADAPNLRAIGFQIQDGDLDQLP